MMTTKKVLLAVLTSLSGGLIMAGPAQAALSIGCTDMKSDSSVEILLGAGPVPNFLSVTIALGDRHLTTVPGQPGEQVSIAQAYDDGEVVRVDLVDPQAQNKIAAIRIIRANDKAGPFQIGYVQLEGDVAVGITCEGP
ncbi:MAG: hypothetical protein GY948_14475 [Alphaproteobacteria bacterium]|nr:hypothetical protein [Alphaproteobacteria bacterium]